MEYKTVKIDASTNEVIERVSTADEIKEVKKLQAKLEAIEMAKETKASAKAALLDKLGITEDEAKLLLG
jgi:hypothetical protein